MGTVRLMVTCSKLYISCLKRSFTSIKIQLKSHFISLCYNLITIMLNIERGDMKQVNKIGDDSTVNYMIKHSIL